MTPPIIQRAINIRCDCSAIQKIIGRLRVSCVVGDGEDEISRAVIGEWSGEIDGVPFLQIEGDWSRGHQDHVGGTRIRNPVRSTGKFSLAGVRHIDGKSTGVVSTLIISSIYTI